MRFFHVAVVLENCRWNMRAEERLSLHSGRNRRLVSTQTLVRAFADLTVLWAQRGPSGAETLGKV